MIDVNWFTWQIAFAFCYYGKQYKPDTTKGFAYTFDYILN